MKKMNDPLILNTDYYLDEYGNMVFTESYHIKKGFCCGNGCRHCPFQYESVPEPKRSAILAKAKDPSA